MARSSQKQSKPRKPYRTFPLTPHPNGQWCKKICGKVRFFGVWADGTAALENYNRQAADLHAGKQPKARKENAPSIKDLGNRYLAAQGEKAKRGLITAAWFGDCLRAVRDFVHSVGKERCWDDLRPADFAEYRLRLYDRFGVCAIDRTVTIVRAMLKHAYETDLIEFPVKYGGQFNKPSLKEKRQSRSRRDRDNGKRLFRPREIRLLLDNAQQPLKAMTLLGINGGFGNTDCAELPIQAVDLKRRVVEYERPKTAVQRVVPLWPETVDALGSVLHGERPNPRKSEYETLVFLTVFGNPWKKEMIVPDEPDGVPKVARQQAVTLEFSKLLDRLGLKRPGLGFYALRHTFRTWADETHDQHAIHRIMGHAIPGMSGVYVEEIGLSRLRSVVNHVRRKVFSRR